MVALDLSLIFLSKSTLWMPFMHTIHCKGTRFYPSVFYELIITIAISGSIFFIYPLLNVNCCLNISCFYALISYNTCPDIIVPKSNDCPIKTGIFSNMQIFSLVRAWKSLHFAHEFCLDCFIQNRIRSKTVKTLPL